MKNAYLEFVSSVGHYETDREVTRRPDGTVIHATHGCLFAVKVDRAHGMMLCAVNERDSFDGLDSHIDASLIPGVISYRDTLPVSAEKVSEMFAVCGTNAVISADITRGGIRSRQTVFTFDGGIAVLGCGLDCGYNGEEPMPVFEIGVMRAFADPEKMKVYKNTTTHAGLIYRTLIDDVKVIRHIRPSSPLHGESRNIFSLALQTGPLMPCYAYEITTLGMGFGCQLLSNNDTCQAIMVDGGRILSFDPIGGCLSEF